MSAAMEMRAAVTGDSAATVQDGAGLPSGHLAPVVVGVAKREFTFASRAQQIKRIGLLERSGYRVVFNRGGYIVLHRGSAPAGVHTSQAAPG
jgi:hypothetical protein